MKTAGYLLAFYLILLAAVPCCAFDDRPDDKTELAAEHESNDGDCGTCSPFFSCEGCATASISNDPAPFEIHAIKVAAVFTCYIQTALPSIEFDFWQPPRLV